MHLSILILLALIAATPARAESEEIEDCKAFQAGYIAGMKLAEENFRRLGSACRPMVREDERRRKLAAEIKVLESNVQALKTARGISRQHTAKLAMMETQLTILHLQVSGAVDVCGMHMDAADRAWNVLKGKYQIYAQCLRGPSVPGTTRFLGTGGE